MKLSPRLASWGKQGTQVMKKYVFTITGYQNPRGDKGNPPVLRKEVKNDCTSIISSLTFKANSRNHLLEFTLL